VFVVVGAGKTHGITFMLYLHSYVSRINQVVGNDPLILAFLLWQVNCQLSCYRSRFILELQ
jgi:hypothetical protein